MNQNLILLILIIIIISIITAGYIHIPTYTSADNNLLLAPPNCGVTATPTSALPYTSTDNNLLLAPQDSGDIATPTSALPYTSTVVPTEVLEVSPNSLSDRNIETIKNIVEAYHQTHTYNLSDMYACAQMSQDVWDMVETKGISAIINVGNVTQNINTIQEADHTWVLAEVSPGEYIALETTGGYLVCSDPSICAVNNPRYYIGWNFKTPKELQDYLNNH
jgi:hypothetical protein